MDRFLPDADESVAEHTLVGAGVTRTYAAVGGADVSGDRLLGLLGLLGGLTDLAHRMGGEEVRPRTLGELLGPELGFVPLLDAPGETRVVGLAARYNPFERGVERLQPDRFADFAEPGHVKVVVGFTLRPQGGDRTLLSCDLRLRGTDDDTRSTLRTAWFLVGPALRLLARRALDLIREEAESGSGAGGGE